MTSGRSHDHRQVTRPSFCFDVRFSDTENFTTSAQKGAGNVVVVHGRCPKNSTCDGTNSPRKRREQKNEFYPFTRPNIHIRSFDKRSYLHLLVFKCLLSLSIKKVSSLLFYIIHRRFRASIVFKVAFFLAPPTRLRSQF